MNRVLLVLGLAWVGSASSLFDRSGSVSFPFISVTKQAISKLGQLSADLPENQLVFRSFIQQLEDSAVAGLRDENLRGKTTQILRAWNELLSSRVEIGTTRIIQHLAALLIMGGVPILSASSELNRFSWENLAYRFAANHGERADFAAINKAFVAVSNDEFFEESLYELLSFTVNIARHGDEAMYGKDWTALDIYVGKFVNAFAKEFPRIIHPHEFYDVFVDGVDSLTYVNRFEQLAGKLLAARKADPRRLAREFDYTLPFYETRIKALSEEGFRIWYQAFLEVHPMSPLSLFSHCMGAEGVCESPRRFASRMRRERNTELV